MTLKKIETLASGMTLATPRGPRRIVAVVGVGDEDRAITVVSRPLARRGGLTEETWFPGALMRVEDERLASA